MKCITTQDLERMDVINLCDGARLGCPSGLEIDLSCGSVTALLVPKDGGHFFSFGKETYRIPWCRVQCVGEDTVLVKMDTQELMSCLCRRGGKGGLFGTNN